MVNPLFGYEFKKDINTDDDQLQSFATPVTDDGAVVVSTTGTLGTIVDLDGSIKSEAELITKYREMSMQPEIDSAVQDIVNEAIVMEDGKEIVEIDLENIKAPDKVKTLIVEAFEKTKELLEFNTSAYDIFERFYVDGRIYYHAIIDPKKSAEGIQKLQYIDPRKIRKIRETKPNQNANSRIPNIQEVEKTRKEYYIYNENGFSPNQQGPGAIGFTPPTQGIKIAKDAIIHITSGKVDTNLRSNIVLSHLHKAIKPLNQLRALEDSALIYRIARAPERRIFYIDTGNLPKNKAEQHIREMMIKYKNKLVYDPNTGEIRDSRKFMTMLEDFWFSRRGDGKSTEIDTLKSAEMTGIIDEIDIFQRRLYKSLNVPYSRFSDETPFVLGGSGEISRDEIKFSVFIDKIRIRFNNLFLKILKTQLVLTNVIKPGDWHQLAANIKFKYARNNVFAELKNAALQMDRLQRLTVADQFVGKYFSHKWVRKNILSQTEQEQKEEDNQIQNEQQQVQFNPAKLLQAPQGSQPPNENGDQQDQEDDRNDGEDQNGPSPNMLAMKNQLKKQADDKNSRDNKKINKKIPIKKLAGKRNGR